MAASRAASNSARETDVIPHAGIESPGPTVIAASERLAKWSWAATPELDGPGPMVASEVGPHAATSSKATNAARNEDRRGAL